jgi:hypothetical protein
MTRELAVKALVNKYFNDEDVISYADCLFFIRVATKDIRFFDIDSINGCKEYKGVMKL